MPTEIDHDAIKTRIVAVLKGTTTNPNTAVFNLTKTVNTSTFRTIAVGAPNMNEIKELNPPAIIITNDDTIEDDEIMTDAATGTVLGSKHTFRYLLIYIDKAKDGATTEKRLDDFGKSIKEVLKANYQLKTVDAGTDPQVDRIFPEQTAILNRDLTGGRFQGRVIRLKCTKRTN